ncbi:MAG: citrate synthase [Chloroflexi bacterium]|nr:citrate synthase [Chloroflexota bacterium]
MAVRKFVERVEFAKGLEGAITNESSVGYVDGDRGDLVYRGYSIYDLAEHSTFEESSYLLLFGKLPTQKELDEFNKKLVGYRQIPGLTYDVLRLLPKTTHPMAAMRTAISSLGNADPDADKWDVEHYAEIGTKLIAQAPTVTAAIARLRKGLEPIAPDPNLSLAANLLYMLNGEKPDETTAKVLDVCLVLHQDHEQNASTFTCMVVESSQSDIYSVVTGGIGSLKGPLHGGANEQAITEIQNVRRLGGVAKVPEYVKDAQSKGKRFMGFGHRVYKAYDPRARILKKYADQLSSTPEDRELFDIAVAIEKQLEPYQERGIFPNVDFYSGIVYHSMGIERDMFTPLFVVGRMPGWVARVMEYLPENRLFRPRAIYIGEFDRQYMPIDQRK